MSVLRLLCLLVLAIWVGGLAVLGGLGAPTIFAVLESADPVNGRDTAALVFGAIFERFQYLAWVLGLLLLALLGTRAALGPRPRRFGWRMWTTTAMLAVSVYTVFSIAPRIDEIRETTPGSIQALPDGDPIKAEFGRLHGASNGLMLVTMIGGVWLMWIELRDRH